MKEDERDLCLETIFISKFSLTYSMMRNYSQKERILPQTKISGILFLTI